MSTIAANRAFANPLPTFATSDANGSATAPAGTTAGTSSSNRQSPAVIVGLSDAAKAAAARLEAARAAIDDIPKSLAEIVERKTTAFTDKLLKGLEDAGVRLDDPIGLHVDRFGRVTADGPQKEKIEKYFRENPDAAKEFKDIAGLQDLKAASEALRLYSEEKKAARNEEERDQARDRFSVRSLQIHELSGFFTLEEGKLVSAASLYADALSPPNDRTQSANHTDLLV